MKIPCRTWPLCLTLHLSEIRPTWVYETQESKWRTFRPSPRETTEVTYAPTKTIWVVSRLSRLLFHIQFKRDSSPICVVFSKYRLGSLCRSCSFDGLAIFHVRDEQQLTILVSLDPFFFSFLPRRFERAILNGKKPGKNTQTSPKACKTCRS